MDMYASPTFIGYSLWLVGGEPARSKFQTIISDLSIKYNTPHFEPHVTLLAGVGEEGGEDEIVEKTRGLASKLEPVLSRVECCSSKDLFFQSVFAVLKKEDALMSAHTAARVAFGQDPEGVLTYMPHLSLIYGDLAPSVREDIIQTVEENVKGTELCLKFIEVWCTKGHVSEWYKAATIPLQVEGEGKTSSVP
ncbi:unnamed protein product [Choristocarpus tenellus]